MGELVKSKGIMQCVPECQDTRDWRNGYKYCGGDGHDSYDGCFASGWSCAGYVKQAWCANGRPAPGSEFAFGQYLNYPEQNCCACGGGSVGDGEGACKPASIRRRRHNGASSMCSCRRRSSSIDLPQGWGCTE